MIYHSIRQYLKALEKWKQTPARISPDGEMTVRVKGQFIPLKEYLAHNSKPVYEPRPKANPDGTKIPLGILPEKQN